MKLSKMLYDNIVHAKSFRMASERLRHGGVPNLKLKLIAERNSDGRINNLSTVFEVVALIVGDIDSSSQRDIIMEIQSGQFKIINELQASYLAFQNPLLFPYGEDGYRNDVCHRDRLSSQGRKRNRVTVREWMSFRLQSRKNEAQTLLCSRRLFHQVLVDAYTMVEYERAILASTIDIVDQINEYVLSIIPCEENDYLSSDSVDMSDVNDIETVNILTTKFLNTLSTSDLPNHKIKLKLGTPIMLLRNLDQSEGLCNGTRLVVTKMAIHVLEAKIMSSKNVGHIIYIPRMSMSPSQSPWPFKLIRRQFPIIVSYVMTINKSQCQSLEMVELYLPKLVFSHGQLYVAISRVKNKEGLKILIHDKDGNPLKSTNNVVYKEVFQNL
ncbi:hypothetical protein Lal_00033960 [Lupinus albus]|nr:hypothetical protein Lal_00033960 [Lupinus albus]